MTRTAPVGVRRKLRQEVGFGCPIPGCGSPYLEYHHFNPPFRVEEHFRPEGMIALCAEHHSKAEGGAFTSDQLSAYKQAAVTEVGGRFDWLRRNVLAVVGGSFFYETPVVVAYKGEPQIWFERDDAGHLLLSLRMVSASAEPRLQMDANDWLLRGAPEDFECPPSGRRIHARYHGGDRLTVEFIDLSSRASAVARYHNPDGLGWGLVEFPVLAIEVTQSIGGTDYGFEPSGINVPGMQIQGSFGIRCASGLDWG